MDIALRELITKRLTTTRGVSLLSGISESSIRGRLDRKTLDGQRLDNGVWLIDREDLPALLDNLKD